MFLQNYLLLCTAEQIHMHAKCMSYDHKISQFLFFSFNAVQNVLPVSPSLNYGKEDVCTSSAYSVSVNSAVRANNYFIRDR